MLQQKQAVILKELQLALFTVRALLASSNQVLLEALTKEVFFTRGEKSYIFTHCSSVTHLKKV